MVRDELLRVRARAETEATTLAGDLESLFTASRDSNADDEHDPEGATIAFEREQLVSIMTRVKQTMGELRQALRDLDDGSYGICQSCGQPIDPARLEIRPQATLCVACANLKR
jgi:RNA polymerase-binding transcription factor